MILFVCTGNTCRSPMAATLAVKLLGEAGVDYPVLSAGVYAAPQCPASAHAVAVMQEENCDLRAHRSQQVTQALITEAACVFVMTEAHRAAVTALCPDAGDKVFILGAYAGEKQDITDPFGGGYALYRACASQIKGLLIQAMPKIISGCSSGSKPPGGTVGKGEGIMETLQDVIAQRLHIARHPLVKSKITLLRDKNTGNREFRELVDEITSLLTYIATRDLNVEPHCVETPVGVCNGWQCVQKFGVVPILRAGLGMVDAITRLLPTAKIGHIGMYRNPDTLQPVDYYCKLPPEIEEREILLVDPMVATGYTAARGIDYLKKAGAKHIKLLCLVAAPQGVEEILRNHPDVDIYAAAYDNAPLNDHGYIVPGLGDAGDRIFGTR